MTEATQVLLFAVIISLTILMIAIGWQIFQILTEIRKVLIKFNFAVDNTLSVTGNINKSISSLSGFAEGLKIIFGFLKVLKKKKDKHDN